MQRSSSISDGTWGMQKSKCSVGALPIFWSDILPGKLYLKHACATSIHSARVSAKTQMFWRGFWPNASRPLPNAVIFVMTSSKVCHSYSPSITCMNKKTKIKSIKSCFHGVHMKLLFTGRARTFGGPAYKEAPFSYPHGGQSRRTIITFFNHLAKP